MEKQPEFKDKWILVCFAAGFILFVPMGIGMVPEHHGAYWREVLAVPLILSFAFTVIAGLARPAGWLSALGLWALGHWLPEIESRNLQLYFWLVSYFTLFFSIGDRITLGKILKVALLSGPFLLLAYFLEPLNDRGGYFQGFCNWLSLLVLLVLVNGLLRGAYLIRKRKDPRRLDWID